MKNYDSIVRVGVDLAQSVVQLHAVDAAGNVVIAKQIQRSALIAWCERLHEGCIAAFEACSAAHTTWRGSFGLWASSRGSLRHASCRRIE